MLSYAERHILFSVMQCVLMLSPVMLNVTMLIVVAPYLMIPDKT
jgi:hypothetical protein